MLVKSSTSQPARKCADLLASSQRLIRFPRECEFFRGEAGLALDLGVIDPSQALTVAGLPLRPQRGTKYESLWKTVHSAALRKSVLSPRSRDNIASIKPIGFELLALLDGKKSALDSHGSWRALAFGYDETTLEPGFRAALAYLIQVQEAVQQGVPLVREGRHKELEVLLREVYRCNPVAAWQDVLPASVRAAALPLHSALTALAVLDAHEKQRESVVLRLLARNGKPMANWCASVAEAYQVDTLEALAGRAARLRKDGPGPRVSLSHGLLRQWSSGAQLPHRPNRDALLSGLHDRDGDHLRTCHAIARFLTFLVSAVAAYSEGTLQWGEAQVVLRGRYDEVYRAQLSAV